MKNLLLFFASFALVGIASCDGIGNIKGNTSGQDTDSLTEEDLKIAETNVAPGLIGDSSFVGIICAGSNETNLVLCSKDEDGETDTVKFVVDADVDKSNFNGLVEGGPCEVVFSGDLKETPKATYIETYATYTNAVGRWFYVDAENSDKKVGFEFMPKGKANSFNTKYQTVAWQMYDDRSRTIFITVNRNGISDDITGQLSEDGKTLTVAGDARVFTKDAETTVEKKVETKEQ